MKKVWNVDDKSGEIEKLFFENTLTDHKSWYVRLENMLIKKLTS